MAIVSGICDRVSSQSRAKRRGWTLPSINYLFSPIGATLTGIVVAWLTGVLVGGAH